MREILLALAGLLAVLTSGLHGQVPQLLNYQGRVIVAGVNFNGGGQFKFALVNGAGDTAYWSNDETLGGAITAASEPATAVSLPVNSGLYSVLLGDTAITNMQAIPVGLFANADVRLRVWFDDGSNGVQLLTPDQRIAAVGYALTAGSMSASSLYSAPARPVIAWGANGGGQTTVPLDLVQISQVAAGADHSLALKIDGTVQAWGRDSFGQVTIPAGLADVAHIAAGVAHSLAVKNDGTVVTWGNTGAVPGGLANVIAAAGGLNHSLVLKSNGTVEAWGDNSYDQLATPGGLADVTAIACGYDHNLVLKADGSVQAWGRNDTTQTDVPSGLNNVVAIAAGAFHSLAVKADGTVVAWGWDLGGQSTVPGSLTDVIAVAGGYSHSIALKSDGTVVAWGDDEFEQTDIPQRLANVAAIASTGSHTLALRSARVPVIVARLDEKNFFTEAIGIGRAPTTNMLEVEGQASKAIAGNWSANSDRRIKLDILPVNDAIEKLDRVRLVSFRYTDAYRAAHSGVGDGRYLNVIAQEFAKVFPEHVRPSGEHLPDGSAILQVDTYPLTIYAAAAVQELNQKLIENQSEMEAMRKRLAKLERLLLPQSTATASGK